MTAGPKTIVVVGCGPKAIAIAAKARVLKDLGWRAPDIVAIDRHAPAANWDGTNGYTDGKVILGTTPLEDVGFPYASTFDPSVDRDMLKYSYAAYLIDIGRYAEWVDRGLTPPSHSMFADYFKWVADKVDLPVIAGTVATVDTRGGGWTVGYVDRSGSREIRADGLVVTGPGAPKRFARVDVNPEAGERIFDGQTFWQNTGQFAGLAGRRVAVIGGGETAAAIVTHLIGVVDDSTHVEVVTRHPILFTRNEHWQEVMYFSTVMDWQSLSAYERAEVIRHADRGTFSVAAKNALDAAYNVHITVGDVLRIEAADGELELVSLRGDREVRCGYDYIVEATGFDPLSFVELFADGFFDQHPKPLSEHIQHDLSVQGSAPKLHLPGLAAMAQGPGFPNLSCLGLLSDRVLAPYVRL